MISFGAINGAALNALALDAGTFRFDAAGAASSIGVGGAAVGVRRVTAKVASAVTVSGAVVGTRRCVGLGASSIVVNGAVVARRRAVGRAASSMALDAAAVGVRRAVATGASAIALEAGAAARFRVLRRATPLHTYFVPVQRREFVVPPEPPAPELRQRRGYLVGSQRRAL